MGEAKNPKPIFPLNIEGKWTAVLTDENGDEKQRVEGHNLVVTNGLERLAQFLKSATSEVAGDTALGAEQKIWNDGPVDHEEEFLGEKIFIPRGEFIEMPRSKASKI